MDERLTQSQQSHSQTNDVLHESNLAYVGKDQCGCVAALMIPTSSEIDGELGPFARAMEHTGRTVDVMSLDEATEALEKPCPHRRGHN